MHNFSIAEPPPSSERSEEIIRRASVTRKRGCPRSPQPTVGVSRWLTRTACAAHFCQCGFGFAIRTVRASHRLPLRRFVTRIYAQSGLTSLVPDVHQIKAVSGCCRSGQSAIFGIQYFTDVIRSSLSHADFQESTHDIAHHMM